MGEVIAGKSLGKKAMLFGAVANNLPDIDMFAAFWVDEVKLLLIHRGITHSVLFNMLTAIALAFIFNKAYRRHNINYSRWLLLFGSGLFTHILTDACTTYGTGLFEPFSDARISFNNIFILDPLFSIPVLVSGIVILALRRTNPRRMAWARGGLIISAAYIFLTVINKLYINSIVKGNLKSRYPMYRQFTASPTPLNNLLWYITAKQGDEFLLGYYSLFDHDSDIEFMKLERNEHILDNICDSYRLAALRKFSQDYYNLQADGDTVFFNDLRFGQVGGWKGKETPFVFSFRVGGFCDKNLPVQRDNFGPNSKGAIGSLFERIKGD